MIRNIKQFFCRHKRIECIAQHEFTQQNLWYCPKCGIYYIQHYGIGVGCYSKTPMLEHWKYNTDKPKKSIK